MRPFRIALPCILTLLVPLCALAVSGTVVDPDGRPLEGASACLMIQDTEQECVRTDAAGFFQLPPLPVSSIRVFIQGYLPESRDAVDHAEPIVLQPSATIVVKLLDAATGEALPSGEVWLISTSGRKRGPFPVRAAGLMVRTLRPGPMRVVAEAAGYAGSRAAEAQLVAGEETRVDVRMEALKD